MVNRTAYQQKKKKEILSRKSIICALTSWGRGRPDLDADDGCNDGAEHVGVG